MFWLIKAVNFSTSIGHDSPKWLACENKTAPNAAITKKVSNRVITIAAILFIFILTIKFTTGWSIIEKTTAKTNGIRMLFAIYIIAIKAIRPTRKMVTFA
jgi:hypothetical protein